MINLEEMKKLALPIIEKYHKILVSLKKVKEFGINKIVFTIDDPETFILDIDEVASINEEILDAINDLIPDGYYLEVSSLGAERELITDEDYKRAINQYIYVSTYQKVENASNLKEFYGYLKSYDDEKIIIDAIIKTRTKEIIITRSNIAKIRLAVNFKESEEND
ncbi:MAG: ribosome maturation factor RimP [Bacilli bacterium]|nr:ribosome maturation factor RimP [Mollicutes bacterium]MDY3899137.1 ribosome maturation factor RimP [Bacilli bacterium]